jgi:opacity protein-like surface antigen
MKKITLLLALACVFYSTAYLQTNKSDCKKRIKIKAIPYNGKQWIERTMEVYVHYKELSKKEINTQLKNDSARYQGWDFQKLENPTNKMDCAGYTYHNQFLLAGEYWITARQFYQNLILPFAKQISDRRTWGDAKVNDIVVFKLDGEAK